MTDETEELAIFSFLGDVEIQSRRTLSFLITSVTSVSILDIGVAYSRSYFLPYMERIALFVGREAML